MIQRTPEIYDLLSDNTAPMAPELLQAIVRANEASAMPSYGSDGLTQQAREAFGALFGAQVELSFTSTGTAANALSLAVLCPPWKRVLCQRYAHVMETEAGAPEAFGGGLKLSDPGHGHAKITAADVEAAGARCNKADPHSANFGVVTLAQTTELGLVYAAQEVAQVGAAAKAAGLRMHVDGARLANAVVATGADAAAFGPQAGVTALSFGLAKNGGALGDAALVFDPELAEELRFRQMRAGHLMSKGRYIAAQALAALKDGLWLRLGAQANAASADIGAGLEHKGYRLAAPVESNQVFVCLPLKLREAMVAAGYPVKLVPGERFGLTAEDMGDSAVVRLVTAWNTSPMTVKALLDTL